MTDESPSRLAAQVSWPQSFLATASKPTPFQGTLTQKPRSLGLGCQVRGGWLWGWNWDCVWEPHYLLCQEPFSEATEKDFVLLEARGSFVWRWPFSSSVPCEGAISSPIVLSPMFHLPCILCSFCYKPPGSLGKVVDSGFNRGKINNTVFLKKKDQQTRMTSATDFEDVLPVSDLVRPVIPYLYPPTTHPYLHLQHCWISSCYFLSTCYRPRSLLRALHEFFQITAKFPPQNVSLAYGLFHMHMDCFNSQGPKDSGRNFDLPLTAWKKVEHLFQEGSCHHG